MIKIAAITSTRADFGLLSPLLVKMNNDANIDLKLIVTGAHLSHHHGMTIDEIMASGLDIDVKIAMNLDNDDPTYLTKSAGDLTQKIAQCFHAMKPDAVLILGDRFEILPAAYAATMQGVKIIHIHGGEITLGAIDNKIRNAISSMADLHLAATEASKQRLINGGAVPERVIMTGALGVENAISMAKFTRRQIEEKTQMCFAEKNILLTFHPETMSHFSAHDQITTVLNALAKFDDVGKFISLPNADQGNEVIRKELERFSQNYPHTYLTHNLGHQLYLSIMNEVDAVIGNSSSGIIEAPALGVSTVNIGGRQKGREQATTIIQCAYDTYAIIASIRDALVLPNAPQYNDHPYYFENTSETMLSAIREFLL